MADPVSLLASLVTLITTGAQVSVLLNDFINNLDSAQSEIRDLARALNDLCLVLSRLKTIFDGGNNAAVGHELLLRDFRGVLESCMEKLNRLHNLVRDHKVTISDRFCNRSWKKLQWALHGKEVIRLMNQLEAHKSTLSITLLMSSHSQTMSVKVTVETALEEVKKMGHKVEMSQESLAAIVQYLSNASVIVASQSGPPISSYGPGGSPYQQPAGMPPPYYDTAGASQTDPYQKFSGPPQQDPYHQYAGAPSYGQYQQLAGEQHSGQYHQFPGATPYDQYQQQPMGVLPPHPYQQPMGASQYGQYQQQPGAQPPGSYQQYTGAPQFNQYQQPMWAPQPDPYQQYPGAPQLHQYQQLTGAPQLSQYPPYAPPDLYQQPMGAPYQSRAS